MYCGETKSGLIPSQTITTTCSAFPLGNEEEVDAPKAGDEKSARLTSKDKNRRILDPYANSSIPSRPDSDRLEARPNYLDRSGDAETDVVTGIAKAQEVIDLSHIVVLAIRRGYGKAFEPSRTSDVACPIARTSQKALRLPRLNHLQELRADVQTFHDTCFRATVPRRIPSRLGGQV